MVDFPNTGAPMWAASQATPWDTQNEAGFIFDAAATRFIIEDRDLTAPPRACANGAAYLIDATATGLWTGEDGNLAIAIGTNASNGWYFATVASEGKQLYVKDEDILIEHDGSVWATAPGGVSYMDDLTDVNAPTPSDGDVLVWDAGDSEWKSQAPAAGYSDEQARDAIGAALTGGTGITVTPNDGADTITIASTVTQYTDEMARDALGTALVAGTGISITPNDGADTITIAATGGLSLASTTEVLTGTDSAKAVTADALAALWEQGSDVASSGTISIGEGGYFNITGTTTITDIDFATDKAGREVWVKFAGVLTLTHNASTLILPTGANIVTAAGDTACFVSEGSDVVRCVAYNRASGAALSGTGGSGKYEKHFDPHAAFFPTSSAATPDFRNAHPVLDFVNSGSPAAYFGGALPSSYGGAGLTVDIWIAMTSATSGNIGMKGSIERIDASSLDIDSDSFATAQSFTTTAVPGTSGQVVKISLNFSSGTDMDSLAAGEMYRFKLERDNSVGSNASGDAELVGITIREQ